MHYWSSSAGNGKDILQCWYDCGKQNFFALVRILFELDLFGNDSNGCALQ